MDDIYTGLNQPRGCRRLIACQSANDAMEGALSGRNVTEGNLAKFSQHEDIKQFLLDTRNAVIVEASPRDRIWGIGMGAGNENATNPAKWRGQNLLGFALMDVRSTLASS